MPDSLAQHNMAFSPATSADATGIAQLLKAAFTQATVAGWSAEALDRFHDRHAPEAIDVALTTASYQRLCVSGKDVVGYIMISKPSLLTLLAVAPTYQGCGIGSYLLNLALDHINLYFHHQVSLVEVSATGNSAGFYRRHGFYPVSPMIEVDGRRFVRMAYWRGLALLPIESVTGPPDQ
jgi:predicted N-acetyltransferase YhbS